MKITREQLIKLINEAIKTTSSSRRKYFMEPVLNPFDSLLIGALGGMPGGYQPVADASRYGRKDSEIVQQYIDEEDDAFIDPPVAAADVDIFPYKAEKDYDHDLINDLGFPVEYDTWMESRSRLSRGQLRRLILEAVVGPDKPDSFILDPELPGDETHPVLTPRKTASYDANISPRDKATLKGLGDMTWDPEADKHSLTQSDELIDSLLGDEPGTKEFSRKSKEYSISKVDPPRLAIKDMLRRIRREIGHDLLPPNIKDLLSDTLRKAMSDDRFLEDLAWDLYDNSPIGRDPDEPWIYREIELGTDDGYYLGKSALETLARDPATSPQQQKLTQSFDTADKEIPIWELGDAIMRSTDVKDILYDHHSTWNSDAEVDYGGGGSDPHPGAWAVQPKGPTGIEDLKKHIKNIPISPSDHWTK